MPVLAHARAQIEQILPAVNLGEEVEGGGDGLTITRRGFQNQGQRCYGLGRIAKPIALDLGDAQEISATLDPGHVGVRSSGQGRNKLLPAFGAFENF